MEKNELVRCSCGHATPFPVGYLTEEQKQNYRCAACVNEPVVERQNDAREREGKQILVEG
jgi:hypothetical protein